jgi:phosphoadenosine phosphosulfate reductase
VCSGVKKMEEMMNAEMAIRLDNETAALSIREALEFLIEKFPGKISFSSSFGMEDQVVTDMIFSQNLPISLFTLDTGRNFEETNKVHNSTLSRYGKKIQVFHPYQTDIENLVSEKGPFSFYESVENRVECCQIRKVKPLHRALKDVSVWITGLRNEQSNDRGNLKRFIFDPANQVIKFNVLFDWSLEQVKRYIKDNHVPYNTLHDKGFISIGCAPCTRAIGPGQNIRDGRWWWENNSSKECGIHTNGNDQ